jgi:hypothetical protein
LRRASDDNKSVVSVVLAIGKNLQRCMKNIFEVGDGDFIKAEQTVYFEKEDVKRVELPVIR